MIQKFILLYSLILFTTTLFSANVKFYNIKEMHGISIRNTNSVCEDKYGFVWASSKTGIVRLTYDEYKIYQLPYERADVITVDLVYSTGKLLAFTNNGQVFSYNEILDRFDLLISLKTELNRNYLIMNDILIENDTYWMATSNGLYKYENEELTAIGNDRTAINKAIWYAKNKIFLARPKGLTSFDTQTLYFENVYRHQDPKEIQVTGIYYDKAKKRLWLGTMYNGLFRYDIFQKKLAGVYLKSFPKQPILTIEQSIDGSLLIGTDGQGIWQINREGNELLNVFKEDINDRHSLKGNGVYDIYADSNNRIWVCTYSGGLSYYEQTSPPINQITHLINNPNSIVNNEVNDIIEDKKGRLWFATDNGISRWDIKTDKWNSFFENNKSQAQAFLTLCEDSSGKIWAGTYSSGVYLLEEETGEVLAHYSTKEENTPLANDFVFDILKDSQNDIWIGGTINSAIVCYLNTENIFEEYSVEPLYSFAELSPGQMLLGCAYGLRLIDKKDKTVETLLDGYLIHDIAVIDEIVWLCSSGNGLIYFNPVTKEQENFTTQEGLPSNFINSILFDDGYLWLGTENGLCRFNPIDKSVKTFPSIPSLSGLSFNRNAYCKLKNGQLAWGTNNGAVIFHPEAIQSIQHSGRIFFQDIGVSGRSIRNIPSLKLNKPVDNLKEIKLKYYQNTINLELLSLGVGPGSKFSWKLEGIDEGWSKPSNNRVINYTNIGYGDFDLKIRLFGSYLPQVLDERTIKIRVTPPFWNTWYFIAFSILFILGVVYLSLRYYINLLKQEHTQEKVRFFTNTAHDIRTSLTLLKAPVEELGKEKKLSKNGLYYLNLAKEQVNRLSSVVTQLMDFQKVDVGKGQLSLQMIDLVKLIEDSVHLFEPLAKSKNITLKLRTNRPHFSTAIDETKIEKAIDNLISNAIKYSLSNSEVVVELIVEEAHWTLLIIDQGIGIGKKAQKSLFKEFYRAENAINTKIVGSGIGLLLVKNYINMHGGTVSFESQEQKGSTFKITIPYKNTSESKSTFTEAEEQPVTISQVSESNNKKTIKTKVLLIEDIDDLRNFMSRVLSEEFEVLTAKNGQMAWEMIPKELPDLIVSDVMMPKMDGFELCKLVKSNYETSHIPLLLLTSLSGKAKQLHGLGLGADDYLTKPFDMAILRQKIKSIIKNRDVVREKTLSLIKQNKNESLFENEQNNQFVKKALKVVQDNIPNPEFNKKAFASAMHVSASLLYKKVKVLTDQSPTDFIKVVRLEHALELLQTKKHSVTEVSELCGFTSIGYFSTVFKKHFGKTPSEMMEG